MKNRGNLLLAAIVLLFVFAAVGYRALSLRYAPEDVPVVPENPPAAESAAAPESAPATESAAAPESAPAEEDADAPESAPAGESAAAPESAPAEESADAPEEAPAAEDLAPDFTVTDGDGNALRLSDCVGSPVIVNFWASWCPPCKEELPAFEAAYQTYGDSIRFLMVDLADGRQETVAGAQRFIEKKGYTFPVYFDTDGSAAGAYRIYAIPRTVAVDAEGRLVRSYEGSMSRKMLEALIGTLLPEDGQR